MLFLLALLLARQRDKLGLTVLAGLSLALAYWVRHPQLPLLLAALPAYLLAPWPMRRKSQHLLVFAAVALAGAVPDLVYHARVLGSLGASESAEWALLSWHNILASLLRVTREGWLHRTEWGYLWPFMLIGIAHPWIKRQRGERRRIDGQIILLVSFLGVSILALCYQAIRPRDLIALFPLFSLWAAQGLVALIPSDGASPHTRARTAVAALLILVVLSVRSTYAIRLPWYPQPMSVYGYVTAEQRESMSALAMQLPPEAVLGAGVGGGALARYTGHEAVQPHEWSEAEFKLFLQQLQDQGSPFYLLDDDDRLSDWLQTVRGEFELEAIGVFDLPTFGRGGEQTQRPATLYLYKYD